MIIYYLKHYVIIIFKVDRVRDAHVRLKERSHWLRWWCWQKRWYRLKLLARCRKRPKYIWRHVYSGFNYRRWWNRWFTLCHSANGFVLFINYHGNICTPSVKYVMALHLFKRSNRRQTWKYLWDWLHALLKKQYLLHIFYNGLELIWTVHGVLHYIFRDRKVNVYRYIGHHWRVISRRHLETTLY